MSIVKAFHFLMMRIFIVGVIGLLFSFPAYASSLGGGVSVLLHDRVKTSLWTVQYERYNQQKRPSHSRTRSRSNHSDKPYPKKPKRRRYKPNIGLGLVIPLIAAEAERTRRKEKQTKKRKPTKPKKRVTKRRRPRLKPVVIADKRYRKKQVVVIVKQKRSSSVHRAIARRYKLRLLRGKYYPLLKARIQSYRIPDRRSVGYVLAQLKRDRRVAGSQPVYMYSLTNRESRKGNGLQYSHRSMRIGEAHKYALGRKVKIAVIDTGLDKKHPEFKNASITQYNAVKPKSQYKGHKHGTAIAGIIAAQERVKGIAPAAHILDARVFFVAKRSGKPETDTMILLNALQWSYDKGAKVFNLSFEGPKDPVIEDAIQAIYEKGRVFVGAAGNGGPKAKPAYPAAYKYVIAATAVDKTHKLYKHANRGRYLTLAAPGVRVMVLSTSDSYDFDSGTSIATAHVSGLIALMLERQPKLSARRIRRILRVTAHDLGKPGPDNDFGAGLADAYSSVQKAVLPE